jgi:hypothetical protein
VYIVGVATVGVRRSAVRTAAAFEDVMSRFVGTIRQGPSPSLAKSRTHAARTAREWKLPALGLAFVAAGVLGGLGVVSRPVAAALELAVGVLATLHQLGLPDPTRLSTRRHANAAASGTLIITWSFSAAVALAVTDLGGSLSGVETRGHGSFTLLMIIAPNVGSLLALFRSVRTRTETAALLRELSVARVATLSTPVIEESVRLTESTDAETLRRGVARMLRLAVSLPLTRDVLDRAALWCRDDVRRCWFVLASSDTAGGDVGFEMPFLSSVTAGAGITANLAIAEPPNLPGCFFEGDVFVCPAHLREHPWFLPSEGTAGSTAEGMAAVILRDPAGDPIGVLSLTTRSELAVSSAELSELVDVLRFWSHSFVAALELLTCAASDGGGAGGSRAS